MGENIVAPQDSERNYMKRSYAERIVEAIGDYVLSTSLSPTNGDIQKQLVNELNQIRSAMDPQAQAKFNETLYVFNSQYGNFKGSPDDIISQTHPWILQRLVQRFRPLSALAGVSPRM